MRVENTSVQHSQSIQSCIHVANTKFISQTCNHQNIALLILQRFHHDIAIEALSLPLPEQDGLQHLVDLLAQPMLTQDISGAVGTIDVEEWNHLQSCGFMDLMKGQHHMPLAKLAMGSHGTVDHELIVSKHVALVSNVDTKALQGGVQVNNLFCACP